MAFFSCLSCFKKVEEEIRELDFQHCSLDDVPNDIFAYERTLERLALDCNNIRDLPRPLFHCHGLRYLTVADNDLQVLPQAVASLAQLVELNVSKNLLTEIPDTIKQCKQLTVLDASINPLQKIPEGCTQLLSITELYLNDTFLEFLPANFGRLSKLKILEIRENALSTLPKSLSRLVNLERLDIGQNELSEVPEVIGSLVKLRELWMDGNRIKQIPPLIGNLTDLSHLELSFNHIDFVSESIGNCKQLTDLSLSTNDLKALPEAVCELTALITLKVDDNQLHRLPDNIGKLSQLEEFIASQNYLQSLPRSIGLCRKLHTLNVDDNDIEVMPKEVGSCKSLKILSAHGNRLTTLPAEFDHITGLAVINVTGNLITHLPVSFMKLRKLTALWLSENQNKPLVQLNQETDPETGQRVLTNFMLPQHAQPDFCPDDISESGSFHASVWEEERHKKATIKWAGEENDEKPGTLRRAPTPFPKEMRAMAKRVQNLRNKKPADRPADVIQRKKNKEFRPRIQRKDEDVEPKVHKPTPIKDPEQIELRQFEELERSIVERGRSPDKTSRDSGVITPDSFSPEESVTPRLPSDPTTRIPSDPTTRLPSDPNTRLPSDPSRVSSDLNTRLSSDVPTRLPSDPLPPQPVKAEIVTNELHNDGFDKPKPPPYHIAAAMSKHAYDFTTLHRPSDGPEYENTKPTEKLERKPSFQSDTTFESISESEASTAPSSLQTIVRAAAPSPAVTSAPSPPPSQEASSDAESVQSHALKLRRVSEQLLFGSPRTRASLTKDSKIPVAFSSPSSSSGGSRPGSQLSQISSIPQLSGREARPSSFAGPPNTVGLPGSRAAPPPRPASRIPARIGSPAPNGLLSTIEQAAHSDDEGSPPAALSRARPAHVPLATSSPAVSTPNYENVTPKSKLPTFQTLTTPTSDMMNTSHFVTPSPIVSDHPRSGIPTPRSATTSKIPQLSSPTAVNGNDHHRSYENVESKIPVIRTSKIPTPNRH